MLIHRSVSKLLLNAILLATSAVATQASHDDAMDADIEDGRENYRRLVEGRGLDPPDPSESSPRKLQYTQQISPYTPRTTDVIELISIADSKDRVTVKVKQSIIGDPEDCQASAKADFFFMVFKHGQTMEDICPFYRDVDACFERTVHIPCDPVSQTATITVYVKSSGDAIHGQSMVSNPYVGRCFPDHLYERPELQKALSYTRTIQCDEWRPKYCSDVLVDDPSAENGHYWLWPTPQAGHAAESRKIYCHNMRGPGKPREYITLRFTYNYSTHNLPEGEVDENGYVESRTHFYKIRVDMDTLKVDVADYRFARTRGKHSIRGWREDRDDDYPVPFASCQGARREAKSEVNLWDTGFNIQDRTDISTSPHDGSIRVYGSSPAHFYMYSENGVWANVGPLLPDRVDTPKGTYNVQLKMIPLP